MTRYYIPFILLFIAFIHYTPSVFSQENKRVAILNPEGQISNGIKNIVREEISNVIVNSATYAVVERAMIDKVFAEAEFQSEGLVDNSQICELGKMMGADLVCYGSVVSFGYNYYISLKMVNVATAKVVLQSTGLTKHGIDDLIPESRIIVNKLIKNENNDSNEKYYSNVIKETPITPPGVVLFTKPAENVLLIALRPNDKSLLSQSLINKFQQRFGDSYTIKVADWTSYGSVRSLCNEFKTKYHCKYVALVTLRKSYREIYYIAETLNVNTKRRISIPVKKELKTKKNSLQDVVDDIISNYNFLL